MEPVSRLGTPRAKEVEHMVAMRAVTSTVSQACQRAPPIFKTRPGDQAAFARMCYRTKICKAILESIPFQAVKVINVVKSTLVKIKVD